MKTGKYIIVKELGHLVPILFHELISHNTFLKCYHIDDIHSAGFFHVHQDKQVSVFGISRTLKLKFDPDDSFRIQHLLETE